MKVIFLDIDGVLNHIGTRTRTSEGFYFIDDERIEILKFLVEQTGAKLVLSSTWREGWADIEAGREDTISAGLFRMLKNKLVEYDLEFIGYTPFSERGYRGKEIGRWLNEWKGEKIESILIIDDYADMEPYDKFLLRTSFTQGITMHHVKKGIKMLEKNRYSDWERKRKK